ncbi:MAG: hypothetical protein J7L47_00765, partial [Candidatus Odinarchaeota archaeon]|nr:hypothetical protein [Candidatus Odinarchaeota archaeon]
MFWFIILLTASIVIQVPLSATEVALFGGLVNSFMFDNPAGPLSLIKYLSAGIIVDVLWIILKKNSLLHVILIGSVAYSMSFVTLSGVFLLFGIKMEVLILGLPYIVALHALVGGFSGVLVHLITKRLPLDRIIPNYTY